MDKAPVSEVIRQDYRITRTASTVTIEVLDYHAEPLTLTREHLRKLGLQMVDEHGQRSRRLPLEEATGVRERFLGNGGEVG